MIPYRTIAIPTRTADYVRVENKAPRYGHPAHTEIAAGHGPCRHCLRTFRVGDERRTLFTYDSFDGVGKVPLPGPIFIHTEPCSRYPEDGGYPTELRRYEAVLDAYSDGQQLVASVHVEDGNPDPVVQQLLQRSDVEYIQVRDKRAGCFDFRIERLTTS